MSAANFCTMRDFPLFAKDYYEDAKRCPECGAILSADDTECEFCECNELEDYQYYDECAAYDERQEIEDKLLDFNRGLLFQAPKRILFWCPILCGNQSRSDRRSGLFQR